MALEPDNEGNEYRYAEKVLAHAQRNYEKGVCESLVSSIKTLTETMNWSVDQAMDALKISEEDKEEIRKKYNIG